MHEFFTVCAHFYWVYAVFERTSLGQELGRINAKNVREAHRLLEEGRTIGKLVLTGF